MTTGMNTVSRFEEADFNGGKSKAVAGDIDELLVKSMAAFREYFDRRFDALDQRFDTLDSLLRSLQNFQIISLISSITTMLAGFAGLIFAVLSRT